MEKKSKNLWALYKSVRSLKSFMIMRIMGFLLLLGVIQVMGKDSYSQNTKVSLNMNGVTVGQVLNTIESQSEFYFIYNQKLVDINRKVSIHAKKEKISKVLDDLFAETDVKHLVLDRQVVLSPKALLTSTQKAAKRLQQQQITVTGKITDEKGEPLPGVNIVVKGTSKGTVSDANGKYTLNVSNTNAILVFSFIGYRTQKIAVSGRKLIDVLMTEETFGLDEVIAIGYGTQKKRDISTAISSVSAKDIKDRPVSDLTQSIAGKMAGVTILNNNAAPGGGSNIVIRGISSINASKSPLIVIDGFPLKDEYNKNENPFNSINPNDVESIEVLKDASSSAIYGTRAANGVILITTKKGKTGKPTINFDISTGFQQMINKISVLNRADFLIYAYDARSNAYLVEDPNLGSDDPNAPFWNYDDPDDVKLYNWDTYSKYAGTIFLPGNKRYRHCIVSKETKESPYDTDWQDAITRNGKVNNFQLSASGGTKNLSYRMSGGYFKQEGIIPTSDYERFSFRANLDLKITDWFNAGLLLAPSLENINVLKDIESNYRNNPFYNAVALPPIWNVFEENGEPRYAGKTADDPWHWNMEYFVNPFHQFMNQDHRKTIKNLSTIFIEPKIGKYVTFRSEFNTEIRSWKRDFFHASNIPSAMKKTTRSQGINQNQMRLYWNWQNFLTYKQTLGRHSIVAMAGYSAEEVNYESSIMNKYDYPTDLIPTLNQALTVVNAQNDARTNQSSESMIGSFARVMYNYSGKYYLTGSVRRDGSSKFGKDKKWGTFPSVSVAWRLSDESFFTPLKNIVNDLKIRAGWGKIGNEGIGNYLALSTLSSASYVLGAGSTVSPAYFEGKVSNSKLGWETTTDLSIGSDFQFFKGRISLSVDYFRRLTEDMLFSMPLPSITGFNSYMANIGSIQNKGYEWSLITRNFVNEFKWTTSFNISYYRNKVLDIGKDKRPIWNYYGYTTEGRPLAGIWERVFLGPYKDWEDIKTSPIVNANQPQWRNRSQPGTAKNADVNGDGIIDNSDRTIIGSPFPDFVWGMSNNFEYKRFDLSVDINAVHGGDIYMQDMSTIFGAGQGSRNATYDYFNNYWRPDRTDAKYTSPNRKRFADGSSAGALVRKGTYVNFQNVILGYTMPDKIVRAAHLSNIRFYLSIQNALFLTKFPGYNPGANLRGNSALSQGVQRSAYPLARVTSFGINLSF